jgi:hypothetical protein
MITGIRLEELAEKAPGMPQGTVEHYQNSCIVCMDDQGHASGSHLHVDFEGEQGSVLITWKAAVIDEMRPWFRDQAKCVDFGHVLSRC